MKDSDFISKEQAIGLVGIDRAGSMLLSKKVKRRLGKDGQFGYSLRDVQNWMDDQASQAAYVRWQERSRQVVWIAESEAVERVGGVYHLARATASSMIAWQQTPVGTFYALRSLDVWANLTGHDRGFYAPPELDPHEQAIEAIHRQYMDDQLALARLEQESQIEQIDRERTSIATRTSKKSKKGAK